MSDTFNLLKQVSDMQMKALVANDTGWEFVVKRMCMEKHMRVLHLDHEPTQAYIDTLFKSAPSHNDRTQKVGHDPDSGLWVVTLIATIDSSD